MGSPVALAVHPAPPARGIDVRTREVATLTFAPPPITCFGAGHITVTDLVAVFADGLTACTYSTERT